MPKVSGTRFFRILYPAFALYSPFFSFLFADEWAAAPDSAGYCRGNLFRRAWRRRWKKRSVPLLRHRPRHVKNSPFVGGRVLIIIPEHTEIAGVRSRPTVWLASSEFVASDARVSLRTRRQPLQCPVETSTQKHRRTHTTKSRMRSPPGKRRCLKRAPLFLTRNGVTMNLVCLRVLLRRACTAARVLGLSPRVVSNAALWSKVPEVERAHAGVFP